MKSTKKNSNFKAIIFDENSQTVNVENAVDLLADQVETESGVYPLEDAKRYVDEWTGNIYYLFNVSLPEKIEAQNLKKLRRSNALTRMFDYDRNKPIDLFKLIPYIIIIVLIVFGGR